MTRQTLRQALRQVWESWFPPAHQRLWAAAGEWADLAALNAG
jgi:hypothetical protein